MIERLEDRAAVREGPASAANHWVAFSEPGRPRGVESEERLSMMDRIRDRVRDDFAWVAPPILNPTTRVSVIAAAASETLLVQGWEAESPATDVFSL